MSFALKAVSSGGGGRQRGRKGGRDIGREKKKNWRDDEKRGEGDWSGVGKRDEKERWENERKGGRKDARDECHCHPLPPPWRRVQQYVKHLLKHVFPNLISMISSDPPASFSIKNVARWR